MAYDRYNRGAPGQGYIPGGHGQHGGQYPPPGQHPQQYDQYPPQYRDDRDHGADRTARIISVVTGVISLIFVLHIIFSLVGANEDNGIVQFVYQLAKVLVLGFGDVFTPDDEAIGLVLNYGLAAIVYLVIGQLIIKAIRRR